MTTYVKRNLIAASQLLNALTGGQPDETTSSRTYRMYLKGNKFALVFIHVVDTLFFFQPEHCKGAYQDELDKRHVPQAIKDQQNAQVA